VVSMVSMSTMSSVMSMMSMVSVMSFTFKISLGSILKIYSLGAFFNSWYLLNWLLAPASPLRLVMMLILSHNIMSSTELVTNSTDEKSHNQSSEQASSSHFFNIFWFGGPDIPQTPFALLHDDEAVEEHEHGYVLECFVQDVFIS